MPKTGKKPSRKQGKGKPRGRTRVDSDQEGTTSNGESAKEIMIGEMRESGFDGTHFANTLEISVEDKIRRGKSPKRNRYIHYCNWAHALLRKEIGPQDAEFSFPPSILAFIRHLVPGNVVGEIREDAYQVTMTEFCQAMELPEI